MSRHRWWTLRIVIGLLILAAATASALPAIDTNTWWIRFLSYPRVQVFWTLAGLLVVSLLLPDRFRWSGVLSSVVAATALGYQGVTLLPWSPMPDEQVAAVETCPPGNRIRVLAVNVQMTNEHASELFAQIGRADPDVVLVQEVDQWWHDQLEAWYPTYPHHVNYVSHNYFGIALLSRYPLLDPAIRFIGDAREPAVFAGIALPAGPTIQFYGVHPRPPQVGRSTADRDAILMAAAREMAKADGPQIIAGDFNATPWSPEVRRLAHIAHLKDPRIGRGWFPTWKAHGVLRRWPLDHVLVSDSAGLADYRVLPPFGSDHQPVLATLCFAPPLME